MRRPSEPAPAPTVSPRRPLLRPDDETTRPVVGAVDVLASAAFHVAPRVLRGGIDRLRLDVGAVVGGLTGPRPRPYSTRTSPPPKPIALESIDPIEHVLPRGSLRRSWVTLRTDLRWLFRDLSGASRPAVVPRGVSRHARGRVSTVDARPAAFDARPLDIVARREETADTVSLVLRERSGDALRFEAGQFLTFRFEIDTRPITRAYSLSSAALDGEDATITVKRVADGRASRYVTETLRPGMQVLVRGPSGSFVAPQEADAPARFVMIAGGSGITPVASIVETVLRTRADRIALLYGSRDAASVIFRTRLDALAARYPDRFGLTYAFGGALDEAFLAQWLDEVDADRTSAHFVCGPSGLRELALARLAARGIEDVRVERFHSPDAKVSAAPSDRIEHVELRIEDRVHRVPVSPGETVLEAAVRAKIDVPFSCTMGGCAACKGRLVEGEVVMEEPNCLSARERADGFVLTCCSRPRGPAAIQIGGT